jgi:hypothetical protein
MIKTNINERLKMHELENEVNHLQEEMYKFFQSAFLEKHYFVYLTQNQSNELNNIIKNYLQKFIERIEEKKRYEVEMRIQKYSRLPVIK